MVRNGAAPSPFVNSRLATTRNPIRRFIDRRVCPIAQHIPGIDQGNYCLALEYLLRTRHITPACPPAFASENTQLSRKLPSALLISRIYTDRPAAGPVQNGRRVGFSRPNGDNPSVRAEGTWNPCFTSTSKISPDLKARFANPLSGMFPLRLELLSVAPNQYLPSSQTSPFRSHPVYVRVHFSPGGIQKVTHKELIQRFHGIRCAPQP